MNSAKQEQQKDQQEQKPLLVKNLLKNPRLSEIKIEDERFFAYEKQRSHN